MERSMKLSAFITPLTLVIFISIAHPAVIAQTSAAETASVTASPSPTKKVTPTPTAKPKPSPKKKVQLIKPSPSPKWPPVGFKAMGDVYYRTPSTEVMMNVAANNPALSKEIVACKEFACGRIQVAALISCRYWEVTSKVVSPVPNVPKTFQTLGTLRTLAKRTTEKTISTLVLKSAEKYSGFIAVVPTTITCQQDPPTQPIPSSIYLPVVAATP